MFHRLSVLVLSSLFLAVAFTSTARAEAPGEIVGKFVYLVQSATSNLGTANLAHRAKNSGVFSQSLRAASAALQGASAMVPTVGQILQSPAPVPPQARMAGRGALNVLPGALRNFNALVKATQAGR